MDKSVGAVRDTKSFSHHDESVWTIFKLGEIAIRQLISNTINCNFLSQSRNDQCESRRTFPGKPMQCSAWSLLVTASGAELLSCPKCLQIPIGYIILLQVPTTSCFGLIINLSVKLFCTCSKSTFLRHDL